MDTKIFLKQFDSKSSVSNNSSINVSLDGKRKLLPFDDTSYTISAYKQYNKERESCETIRLTCQVNTVCTNVLFNKITEIVKDEGSSAVTFLNYGVASGDTKGNSVVSEDVVYKPKTMNFWSGNTSTYQSADNITTMSYSSPISSLVGEYTSYGNSGLHGSFNGGESLAPTNAVRDMQLSKTDSSGKHFVYHCGLDIFNNHLLRSKTFKPICKVDDRASGVCETIGDNGYQGFNTIADVMRDVNGNKVVEKAPYPINAQMDGNVKLISRHLYEYDDVYTFNEALKEKLIDKYNGWYGFVNSAKIKSYSDFKANEEMGIERPIMYKNGGDFIDMYPSRDLYSFVPKWNKFRDRIEKNWNYCITYPSSSTTDGFHDIIETNDGINALKALYFDETTKADNGTSQLVIYSIAKHGLAVGDYVNIYKTVSGTTERVIENAEVSAIADDYIFTVFGANTQLSDSWVELTQDMINDSLTSSGVTINEKQYWLDKNKYQYFKDSGDSKYYIVNTERGYNGYASFDETALNISYKKVINDIECDYYVRIFSRLPNFKFASGTTTEYDLYKKDSDMISTYQDRKKYDFESHVGRLAFAKNIYGDDMGEIVFTDDINIGNLKDNLGRPLSSLYLTILKNNKGYKEWYGFGKDGNDWSPTMISADTVEFSHCFGKLTCAFDLSDEAVYGNSYNSIKTINNSGLYQGIESGDINERPDDTEIIYDEDVNFYGDLSYYDSFNAIERHIQPVLHRFNTAQRETKRAASSEYFNSYVYDEIYYDDYDKNDRYVITSKTVSDCNNKNEGYYYVPHYEIPIRTFDKLNSIMPTFLTIRSLINMPDGVKVTTLQRHFLNKGDKAMIYDVQNEKYYYCTTIGGNGDRSFICEIYDERGNRYNGIPDLFSSSPNISNYRMFKIDNLDIPSYAHLLKDGTCRFIWRDIVNNGMNLSDKSVETYPFTNGAFYVNKRIDLYLRRQDPVGRYGLYDEEDPLGKEIDFENADNYVKDTEITC